VQLREVGRHGPDQDTSKRAFRNDVAQQRTLARAQDKRFGAQQQLSEKRPDTNPSHIVEREPRSEQEALFGLDAVTPEQVTRREGRFVRLAAVDQRRDRDAQRSR
jgi:hypothetical protein